MRLFLLVGMFLLIGVFFIISPQGLHLLQLSERTVFYHQYWLWLSSLFDRGKDMTGDVIHSKWLPDRNLSSG